MKDCAYGCCTNENTKIVSCCGPDTWMRPKYVQLTTITICMEGMRSTRHGKYPPMRSFKASLCRAIYK
ncbi:hypothetical protein MAR_021744 [Mya arenaria]|uniref:Uncharacterized protein n=1 Tax=Mya arenaria TaxID=6604 RepID=A0ABY7E961_MYAAR|nr:hypothetical protein MAR_021744 [Mya arenaria]